MSAVAQGAGSIVGGLVGGVSDAVAKITNAAGVLPADKKAELTEALASLEAQAKQAQNDVNKIEAASSNIFISGWRPFVGWVCGCAFALNFLLQPLIQWGLNIFNVKVQVPTLDLATMLPVLLGMLGLGGMRTYEKANNVQNNH